jgi:O-antigen/teichoic acid export membrane protein
VKRAKRFTSVFSSGMLKENIFQSLRRSELLRNTSILISGTALAQVIPILLQPVLRRYYSAEVFGSYSVYLSLVGILAIISSFKYELAIILPRSDKGAVNILFLTVIINLAFNILLMIIILIWQDKLLRFFNISHEFAYFLYLIPFGIFFYNFYQSINNWLTRKKEFFAVSLNKFVRRGTEGLFQVIFKYLKVSQGIIAGDLAGHVANIISGLYQGGRKGLKYSVVSLPRLKYVARKYSEFPRYNVIPSFMSACSFLLPAILLNKFYSSEYTGYFDLSKLLLSIPLALISTSISNVLLQSIAEKYQAKRSLLNDLLPVFAIVFIISVLEIGAILFFGIGLFKLLFGESWGFSGEISQILVWSYALNFIVASFSAVFISMNKIKLLSVWQVFYFLSILSLILFRKAEFLEFLKIYVGLEIACYTVMIVLIIAVVSRYERSLTI